MERPTSLAGDSSATACEQWPPQAAPLADRSGEAAATAAGVGPSTIGGVWHLPPDITFEGSYVPAVIDAKAADASVPDAAFWVPPEIPMDSSESLAEDATDSSIFAYAPTKSLVGALQPDLGSTDAIAASPASHVASIYAQAAAGLPSSPSVNWINSIAGSPAAQPPSVIDLGPPQHAANPAPASDTPISAHSAQPNAVEHPPSVTTASGVDITNVTTNANGSLSETVTFANSGIVFNNTFDAGVSQAYQTCALSAEQAIASEWSNSVTINEEFSAQAQGQNGELASNSFYVFDVSYVTLKSALTTLASREPGDAYLQQAFAHLPSTDPTGGAGFELALPYARMLGLTSTTENPDDVVTLNTSYNWSYGQDVVNAIEHEISEGGMGRIGGLGDQNSLWSVMDLFRYNSSGALDLTDGRDGRTTFFSYNGGSTLSNLSFNNEYNSSGVQVNGGDTADFVQQDVFGTGNPGETNTLSQTDIRVMEALGWTPPIQGPIVSASNVALGAGQTSIAASSLFTVSDPNGYSITGYGFIDTGPGHFVLNGAIQPDNQEIDITAAQLLQLTYQSAPGTKDTVQIRAEDQSGWGGWASFSVTAPPLLIQTDTNSFGSVSLTEYGTNYFLYAAGTTIGPELQVNGTPFVAGQFGNWTPIGAAQTATGYDLATKLTGADEYSVWSVNSNGNWTGVLLANGVSGNSATLEALEPTFNQDLNGDGVIGLKATLIQTDTNSLGSTSLAEIGSNYFLYAAGTTNGPELQVNGTPFVAGQFGNWTPIGAAQTATGYDLATKLADANEYSVWSVNSNGNWTGTLLAADVPGNNATLEALEPTFNQDLNGDGVIGLKATLIQTDTNSFGSTSLAEIGSNYFMYAAGTTNGPELQVNGAPFVAGEFGNWAPIAAVHVAGGGYDVVTKLAGADEYSVWSVNSNGNWTGMLLASGVSGNSATLEALEPTFNQDLNGDGVIGLKATPIQTDTNSFGSTTLTEVANNFFLYGTGSTNGPELQVNGTPFVAGQYGNWTPISAALTATGYDVATKLAGGNEYSVWSVNSNGNWTGTLLAADVLGNGVTLEVLEAAFNQDLNGDGVIGLYAPPGNTLHVSQPLSGPSGAATIGAGATLELSAADSASVTFAASTGTLQLDQPSTFTGEVFGFTGNGTRSGSDQIDLKSINYNTVQDSYANGILTVTDGTNTVHLSFNGSYSLGNFKFAADGSSGTVVYDPPVPQKPTASAITTDNRNDVFLFDQRIGRATATDHPLAPEQVHFDHAQIGRGPAGGLYDAHEMVIVADADHDVIMFHNAFTQAHHTHLLV